VLDTILVYDIDYRRSCQRCPVELMARLLHVTLTKLLLGRLWGALTALSTEVEFILTHLGCILTDVPNVLLFKPHFDSFGSSLTPRAAGA